MMRRAAIAAAIAACAATGADAPPADHAAAAAASVAALAASADGEILHADAVAIGGLTLQDATAVPRLGDATLTLDDMHARAYGGAVSANAVIALADGGQRWRMSIERLDLGSLLRSLRGADRGVGATVDGWTELNLPDGDLARATGHGELTLRDADLVRFGLLASLLVGDVTGAAHADSAEVRFDLADGRVRLRATRIVSPSVIVQVRGTIGLDGALDLVVIPYPRFKAVNSVPVFGGVAAWLLGAASSRVARATVRGSLGDPVIALNPFAE